MPEGNGSGGLKLNIGCGRAHYPGFVNIDADGGLEPDIILDIRQGLPYKDGEVDVIWFIHTIEHIESKFHTAILIEFWRVLRTGGQLVVAYPEFEKCATNYIENKHGQRDFWRATLYGRQTSPGDYHIALMDTNILTDILFLCGFTDVRAMPEKLHDYNTMITCRKGKGMTTKEELYRTEIFHKEKV